MPELFKRLFGPGDLVFDIGADVGVLTEHFLELGARVVCLEPHPKSFATLSEKFKNNPNVTVVNKGAGDSESELDFYLSKEGTSISSFSKKVWQDPRFEHLSWDGSVRVKTTTLDSLIKEFGVPKFCKIDVEGYELQVLSGLNSKIGTISFEISENFFEDLKLIVAHLDSLGNAAYNFSMSAYYELELAKWVAGPEVLSVLANKYKGTNFYGDMYVKFS